MGIFNGQSKLRWKLSSYVKRTELTTVCFVNKVPVTFCLRIRWLKILVKLMFHAKKKFPG